MRYIDGDNAKLEQVNAAIGGALGSAVCTTSRTELLEAVSLGKTVLAHASQGFARLVDSKVLSPTKAASPPSYFIAASWLILCIAL